MSNLSRESSPVVLIAIGVFKLLKAALLVLLGVVALRLVHQDVLESVTHWVRHVRVDPGNRYVHSLISKCTGLTDRRLEELSVGTFLYAALFTVEGIGLLLRKRWAEYLTVVSTAGLLPLEVYEVAIRPRPAKIVLLVANVAIVVYLIVRLYRTRRADDVPDAAGA